jgi:hypothetical protein
VTSPAPRDPGPVAHGMHVRPGSGAGRRSLVRLVTAGAVALLASGCAERRLLTAPASQPSAGTWVAVWTATALAAGVLGVLLTLPAWRRRTGARFAVALLTAQAGAAVVGGAVLFGMATRTWQLLDHPADAPAEAALLRLSRIDGDTGYFALMVLTTVAVTGLLTVVLATAARLAAADDATERWVAAAVLGLEVLVSAAGAVALVLDIDEVPLRLAATLHLPLAAAALVTCLPRSSSVVPSIDARAAAPAPAGSWS